MKNFFKHLNTVNKHRFLVCIYCFKVGLPIRGLLHDLSKYSFVEFFESIKYYSGTHSPITEAKKDKGYSLAWLHHKGRNKHHFEYWFDEDAPDSTPIIPYKYAAESVCDALAASKTYNGKNWTNMSQIEYWRKVCTKENLRLNPKMKKFYTEIYERISKDGIKRGLTKKNLKEAYAKYCLDN